MRLFEENGRHTNTLVVHTKTMEHTICVVHHGFTRFFGLRLLFFHSFMICLRRLNMLKETVWGAL